MKKMYTVLSSALLMNGVLYAGSKNFTNKLTEDVNITLTSVAGQGKPAESKTIPIAKGATGNISYQSTYTESVTIADAKGTSLYSAQDVQPWSGDINRYSNFTIAANSIGKVMLNGR